MTNTPRERLLKIAADCFASAGFEATTMRTIATRAGVTLPTIYHYFGDKANLYLEVCFDTFAPRADRALAEYERSGATPEQKVLAFFVDLANDLLENEKLFKLLHREMIDQDIEGIRKLTERCWKQSFTALSDALRRIGTPGTDPVKATLSSFALMFGLAEFRRTAAFLHPTLSGVYEPRRLAQFVLSTTVPHVDWSALREPRLRAASA